MKYLSLLILFFFVGACQSSEQKPATDDQSTAQGEEGSSLIGRWAMQEVREDGNDVTEQHNPAGNRWVEFKADGTFVSDGEPYGRNSGRWQYDETTHELYLDSDAGEGDDSYWIASLKGDDMRWKGARSEFTEKFEIVHTRQ